MSDKSPPVDEIENAARFVEAFADAHPDTAELLRQIAQAIRERAFAD